MVYHTWSHLDIAKKIRQDQSLEEILTVLLVGNKYAHWKNKRRLKRTYSFRPYYNLSCWELVLMSDQLFDPLSSSAARASYILNRYLYILLAWSVPGIQKEDSESQWILPFSLSIIFPHLFHAFLLDWRYLDSHYYRVLLSYSLCHWNFSSLFNSYLGNILFPLLVCSKMEK